MDGSSSIVMVMPIMTLIALFTGIALPFIAASRSGRSHAAGRLARADALRRISAARRKARPPEPGANNAAPAEYLYVPCARIRYHGYPAQPRRWVQEVPIVKKTAKWIYYTSDTWDRNEAVVSPGRISRQAFEADTRCHDTCPGDIAAGLASAPHGRGHRHCVHVLAPGRHCHAPGGCGEDCPADTRGWRCAQHGYPGDHCPHGEDRCRHGYPAGVIPVPGDRPRPGPAGRLFFATRQAAEADLCRGERERAEQAAREAPPIKELRRAMADAHPDRGGTADQFIQARRRYETALRPAQR
jgi:NAD-dependent dihydropyrimidine dehydrogenase PreA subunit